jgi:tetratricopeptide (TPR) repeat protein
VTYLRTIEFALVSLWKKKTLFSSFTYKRIRRFYRINRQINKNPTPEAYHKRAFLYRSAARQYKMALEDFQRASDLAPEDPENYRKRSDGAF